MKKTLVLTVIVIAGITAFCFQTNLANKDESSKTYILSIEESELQWKGSWIKPVKEGESVPDYQKSSRYSDMRITRNHIGTVNLTEGVVESHDNSNQDISGEFTVDLTSIRNSDMEGKSSERLEDHLKSEDFFNVSKYAKAQVTLKNIRKGSAQITLELMGRKLEETIPLEIYSNGDEMKLQGEFGIDMKKLDFPLMSPNPEKPEEGHIDTVVDFILKAKLKRKQ